MSSIAILDLGSARLKLLLAAQDEQGTISFARFKEETGGHCKLSEDGSFDEATEQHLLIAAEKLLSHLPEPRPRIIAVASEIFRKATNGQAILRQLQASVVHAPIHLLTPFQEGKLFYDAVALTYHLTDDFAAMDVGGGSVQLAFGQDESSILSFPTGTYSLERVCQSSNTIATMDEYTAMRQAIQDVLTAYPPLIARKTLVLGSTSMEDFFRSALKLPDQHPPTIPFAQLQDLFNELAGQPYAELGSFFPANPFFMGGADKILINVLEIGRVLGTETVIPSNESLSTGITRLALQKPEDLKWIFPEIT